MVNKKVIILCVASTFILGGCNPDMQKVARASCALTIDCYAPGVAPGTNPYNPNAKALLERRKTPTYMVPVRGSCPNKYNRAFLIKSEMGEHSGQRICHYG